QDGVMHRIREAVVDKLGGGPSGPSLFCPRAAPHLLLISLPSCPEYRLRRGASACLGSSPRWCMPCGGNTARHAALAHGWRAGKSPDVLRRDTITAGGQYRGWVILLRLSHRTGSCRCPERSCRVSPRLCQKLMDRGCGRTAARVVPRMVAYSGCLDPIAVAQVGCILE